MDPYKWLPVQKPLWANSHDGIQEGFMVSQSVLTTAITAAASTTTPPAFDTGRGNTIQAIESQVQALQSFYDFYNVYATLPTSMNIFSIVKAALDTLVVQYNAFSDLTYTNKPTTTITDPQAAGITIANLVETYNAYRGITLTNVNTALSTENLPKDLYVSTYTEARKYIQDADMSGALPAVQKAFGYLDTTLSTLSAFTNLPLTATGTADTAGSVRTLLKSALITIVNALVSRYNTEKAATDASVDMLLTNATVVDAQTKRTDVLAKWATLLTTRISNVTTLVGDSATAGSTGTYHAARNSSDSGCVAPYSDTGVGDCWSNATIVARKGEVQNRLAVRDISGVLRYSYGTVISVDAKGPTPFTVPSTSWKASSSTTYNNCSYTSASGDIYTITASTATISNQLISMFSVASTTKFIMNDSIVITLPKNTCLNTITFYNANSSLKYPVSWVGLNSTTGTGSIVEVNNPGSYSFTANTNDFPQTITIQRALTVNNIIVSNDAVNTFVLTTFPIIKVSKYPVATSPLSEYGIVNTVYTTFNTARNNLLVAVNDLTYQALTTFRNAHAALSSYLPTSYMNQSQAQQALTDSAPPTGSTNTTDAKDSTDGKNIYNPTSTSPSLSTIKTKYQDATRSLYNGVLKGMDDQIVTFNGLLARYNSFRQDAEINQLYPGYSSQTLTQIALGTSPADYGISVLATTPTQTQITNLQSTVSTKSPGYTTNTETLRGAVQQKLRLFFDRMDAIALATGYTYTSPTNDLVVGQTPAIGRLREIMDAFAGAEGAAGATSGGTADTGLVTQAQTYASTAMTTFYRDTYLPFVRYLTGTAAGDAAITTAVTKSTTYFYNVNGTTKTFANLQGGDTYLSLKTTVDNGLVAFVQKLVDGYIAARSTWVSYGMATTSVAAVAAEAAQTTQVNVANAVATRATFTGPTSWPQLLADIQAFLKSRIQTTKELQSMYSSAKTANVTVGGVGSKGMGRS